MMQFAFPIVPFVRKLWSFFPDVWNYITRPKILVELKRRSFQFKSEDGEHVYEIPVITFHNKSKSEIKIKANKIWINNESYMCYAQSGNINPDADEKLANAYPSLVSKFYRDNWWDIMQGEMHLIVPPNTERLFPFKLIGSSLTHLNSSKKNSKLFFSKNKISFTVSIDGKIYEYGLNRETCHATYVNYLASYTARQGH